MPKVNNTEETEEKILADVELDIFDMPSVFSDDYGNKAKLKEILDAKSIEEVAEAIQRGRESVC